MPNFAPFDYGQVVAQGEGIKGARMQNVLAQRQLDPNSPQNQLIQEQLTGARQGNVMAQQQGQRAQATFDQQQQQANTKELYQALTEIAQNPAAADYHVPRLKQKGILRSDFDYTHMSPEEISRTAAEGAQAIGQSLGMTQPKAEPGFTLSPGQQRFGPSGEPIAAVPAQEPRGMSEYERARLEQADRFKQQDRDAPPKQGPMSVQLQKELIEADESIQSGKNVISLLDEALGLNKKAYSGYGAKTRATITSNLPGESEAANATIALDNIVTGQALESLKSIFGGMPTEGERKILLDIQASADKTPAQREDIIKRAQAAAKKRISFSDRKAQSIRSGKYLTEGIPETGGWTVEEVR